MSLDACTYGNTLSFVPKEGKWKLFFIFSITYHNKENFSTSCVIPLKAL
jgi:hypothetical protein